jgi:hypothetical protein
MRQPQPWVYSGKAVDVRGSIGIHVRCMGTKSLAKTTENNTDLVAVSALGQEKREQA